MSIGEVFVAIFGMLFLTILIGLAMVIRAYKAVEKTEKY